MMKLRARTGKSFHRVSRGRTARKRLAPGRLLQTASGTEGAQLLEFALCLPMLLVFLVGIVQFGGAFNLKQKMANAAREGTRIMVSNTLAGSGCTSSLQNCSAQASVQAIANYMTNAGVNSSCINPSSPSSQGNESWTYTCGNGISLTINHRYNYTSGGNPMTGTKVTVTYPFTWYFNNVVKLLVPGSNLSIPNRLTETSVMQNISN